MAKLISILLVILAIGPSTQPAEPTADEVRDAIRAYIAALTKIHVYRAPLVRHKTVLALLPKNRSVITLDYRNDLDGAFCVEERFLARRFIKYAKLCPEFDELADDLRTLIHTPDSYEKAIERYARLGVAMLNHDEKIRAGVNDHDRAKHRRRVNEMQKRQQDGAWTQRTRRC